MKVIAAGLILLCSMKLVAAEKPAQLVSEIRFLLDAVSNSGCIFDRNGTRHEPAEAVEHIQRKADYFEDEIDSAESFIELSATRSTMSKKPYHIECPGEPRVESRLWLLRKLSEHRLRQIGVAPRAQRIEADIRALVGFGTRHTLSDTQSETRGIGAARRWIEAEFRRISADCGDCLEVFTVSDTVSGSRLPRPTEVVNVIAIQRGTIDPQRMIVMSGDIDSRVSDVMDANSDSPGANDNASGVAGTLEAARVLSQYQFAGSIVYAALSGEEQGLFGGEILARHAREQGWRIQGLLNNDMIGNITGIDGITDRRSVRIFSEGVRAAETPEEARERYFTGGEVDSASRNVARRIKWLGERYVPELEPMLVYRLDRFGRGGHHRPFNEAGFAAVRIMETHEHYDRQHQDLRTENGRVYGDTLDGVDFDHAAKLTALNAVSLASLAWAPAPPAGVNISGMVSADTTLKWEVSSEANLAGYRVHWRLTDEAQWSRSVDVGNVSAHTLENIVIDNYFFGVSSVSLDGNESPVVFPGPAGAF